MSMRSVIGVIPAAGKGTRIWSLPGSKELFPIGIGTVVKDDKPHQYPKVISQHLIESMRQANVETIYVIISDGKWDIPSYFGNGKKLDVHIAYLVVDQLFGMPYSINQAFHWTKSSTVVFGMPDTIFRPRNSLRQLLDQLHETDADLILGLYPTNQHSRFGMVQIDEENNVIACIDKPQETELEYLWGNACWSPKFSEFLNKQLIQYELDQEIEIVLGDYFQQAVEEGLIVKGHKFPDGEYIDIGTFEDLLLAQTKSFSSEIE